MSVITKVKLEIKLSKDVPDKMISFLQDCLDRKYTGDYDESQFFLTKRWFGMFSTMAWENYATPSLIKLKNGWLLKLHTDINYEDGEIEYLVEWLKPYIFGRRKKVYLGWSEIEYTGKMNIYLNR